MTNKQSITQSLGLLCNSRNDFHQYHAIAEQLGRDLGLSHGYSTCSDEFSARFRPSQVDQTSRKLIPDSLTPQSYVPVRSTGDGNCLFNSASIAICQNEQLACELRLQTCLELALNREHYRHHPVITSAQIPYQSRRRAGGIMSVETLFDIACFEAESSNVFQKRDFYAAFNNEIMRTSINFSYSGTLQIMGLASVLGVPLETVYPEQHHKLLPIYQNVFRPRRALGSGSVRIMWSNTNGWPDRTKEFVVNHFVPLFRQNHSTPSLLNKPCNTELEWEWQEVMRRNHSKAKTQHTGQEQLKCGNKKHSHFQTTQGKELKTKTPGLKTRFDDEKRHCTKNDGKMKENSNRESSKLRSDQEQQNHENKPSVENEKNNNEHIKSDDQGIAAATTSVRQTVIEKEEIQPQIPGARKANKRKYSEIEQSSSSPTKIMKAQTVIQPENNQSIPTMEKKCGVKIHEERENQDTEQKNEESAKDQNNRKDCKHKVLDENERETKGQIKPQEDHNNQGKPIQSKLLRKEKNEIKDNQAQDDENRERTKADTLDKNAEFTEYLRSHASLPFPAASGRFYAKQYDKTTKNIKREKRRVEKPPLFDRTGIVGLQRSSIEGNLEENKASIEKKIKQCNDQSKRAQLLGVAEVAKELQKVLLMPTSRAVEIYKMTKAKFTRMKGFKESTCFRAIDAYEMFSKYLRIDQIYIDQQAFIVESSATDISKVVLSVNGILEKVKTDNTNQVVKTSLKDCFTDALSYLDTKRDRDVMEAIVAKLSSVKSVVSLKGTKFKGSVRGHLETLQSNLYKFKDIKHQSQTVRSDMTVTQQHAHTARKTTEKMKNSLKTIADGKGRKLKCEELPELSKYIEFAFGEGDRVFHGGGGLQADPRLLDTKLFKAADNATVMRHVKELLATVKPNFQISTSCLYTYTMNYRQGTAQAKRHHHGRNINANVSLHVAPNTSENISPINAHWSSSHINYLVDSASDNPNSFLLDSKDAKCIVCGDIAPVLKPGRSWQTFETPDHTFDQSRKNAVTPMTHLFMETRQENADLIIPGTDVVLNVTRTGKAVTLVNLSLSEPETVFRVFNEILYLMSIPSLDAFFRNPETGKLKEIFAFIVDNGPSEAPGSLLVQMLLVRLLKFLDLDKVTQRSFAEYLSKRNFVERVHTIENKVLSHHGPFSSTSIHKAASPGSKHAENMENMAAEVVNCISTGIFNKEPIQCFRGIGSVDNFVFYDEEQLKTFILLSDERKKDDRTPYRPVSNKIMSYLESVWSIKKDFKSTYGEDYCTLTSTKTACLDKYSTSIFREGVSWKCGKPLERFDRQPLPDYQWWINHGDLHYMSFEARKNFYVGPWDESPGIFLPEKVLDTCLKAVPSPSDDVMESIAFLAWISTTEAKEYFANAKNKLIDQKEEDIKRESWKRHPLYKESKGNLVNKCLEAGLSSFGNKHELVRRIVEHTDAGTSHKRLKEGDLYDGNLSSVPSSIGGLMKFPVAYLRAILRSHNVLEVGTKEELITRVGLLKAGYPEAAFSRERLCVLNMIAMAKQIAQIQEDSTAPFIRRARTFGHGKTVTMTTRKGCLKRFLTKETPTIQASTPKRDVGAILQSLQNAVGQLEENIRVEVDDLAQKSATKVRKVKSSTTEESKTQSDGQVRRSGRKRKVTTKANMDQTLTIRDSSTLLNVGEQVEVLWNEKDLAGTNWEPGWYRGEVQSYDEDDDIVNIWYYKDEDVYGLDASSAFEDQIIRSVS